MLAGLLDCTDLSLLHLAKSSFQPVCDCSGCCTLRSVPNATRAGCNNPCGHGTCANTVGLLSCAQSSAIFTATGSCDCQECIGCMPC